MLPEQQQRILGYFIEEAKDHLNTIEQGLLTLQATINDRELLKEVYRAAHSVKGGAGMLSLHSIQKTSHLLEDCFKLLEESPVKVDQKLESLFWRVFDALKELLEQLQGPFGLTEDVANSLMASVEPVSNELRQHLENLVSASAGKATATKQRDSQQELLLATFKQDVMEQLRQMLQLFKPPAWPNSRTQLEGCCESLAQMGNKFELSAWCSLLETAKSAIANEENTCQALAPVVIKEIKSAQELVLSGKAGEICIGEQLQALLPVTLPVQEEEINFEDLFSDDLDDSAVSPDTDFDFAAASDSQEVEPDLFAETLEFSEPETSTTKANFGRGGRATRSIADHTPRMDSPEHPADAKFSDRHGLEVGVPDLNALADLFQDVGDLDDNWQEEETFSDTTVEPVGLETAIDLETESEFADLFDNISDETQTTDEELLDFFNDDFDDSTNSTDLNDLGLKDDSVETEDNLTELFADLPEESINWEEVTEIPDANLTSPNDSFDAGEPDNLTDLFGETTLETENENWQLSNEENLPSDNYLELPNLETPADLDWETATAATTTIDDFNSAAQPEAEFDLAILFDEEEAELLEIDDETSITNESALTNDFGFAEVADNEPLTGEFDFAANDEFWSDEAPASTTANDIDLFSLEETTDTQPDEFSDFALESNQETTGAIEDLSLDGEWDLMEWEDSPATPTAKTENTQLDVFDPFVLDSSTSNQPTDSSGSVGDLFDLGSEDLGNLAPENINFDEDLFGSNLASPTTVSPIDEFTTHIQEFDNEIGAYLAEEPGMEWLNDNSSEASLDLFESPAPATEESFEFGNFEAELTPDSELAADNFLADTSEIDGFDWGAELTETIPETAAANDWQDFTAEGFDFDGLTAEAPENLAELPTEEGFDFDALTAEAPENLAELPIEEDFDFDALTAEEPENLAELSTEEDFDFDALTAEQTEEFGEINGLEANALELDAGGFDDFDLELPGELDAGDSAGDFDFAAEVSETDDFGDLAAMLNEEEAPAFDRSNGLAEFADLEAMLGEEESASTTTSDNSDDLDFGDLEAMLGDESPSVAKAAIPAVAATAAVAAVASQKSDDFNFDDLEKLVGEMDKKQGLPAPSKPRPSQSVAPKRPMTRGILEQTMKVPVKQMDNLSNLVGELVVNRNTLEQEQERLRQFLDNLLTQVQQLSDVGARMQDLYERSLLEASLLASRRRDRYYNSGFRSYDESDSNGNESSNNEHSNNVDYDPLEMDRFTSFHTISQEMIELIVRVRESTADIEFVTDETEQVSRQFRQVTTQLQEGLTRARMVPFGEIERIFPLIRYVREKAAEFGKQAEIKIEGRETLIDKLILEHFSDPLKHFVNNAIAHGIETPEVRQKAGKSPTGKITIKAFHQGNQTVISFSDDGAGINAERVKIKAIEKGLIPRNNAENMSRQELYQLIYHPGFSTKDEADLLSGKGVGMDVVLTSLSEIRGTITTDSNEGKGTVFTIRLPLTLSICKALCCLSDKARIAFPMDGVEDALDIPRDRIQINAEGKPCIPWRDTTLPFKPLSELLTYNRQLGRAGVYGGNKEEDVISIVVLRSPNNLIALQVDQVLGEQEIVIKQLEEPIPKPLGIAGATVQGDGRIMPIADVLELVDLSLGLIRNESGKFWDQDTNATLVPEQPKSDPTVLIIDDSITVRELLSMTFNKTGYRVEQARDGQEAWDKLKSGLPCDIIFCDIEMPRMDGLELLSRLQKDPELNHLPVAMLTSRGADKHRQMAIQLGASGYFTKPYLEDSLLDAASRMLKGEKLVSSNVSA
ncbi:hypothetical protein NIES2119_27290 [[Phormidium ambiguum] IAM M-71]|uniref:histidine kinase n=1 Tax=[Phormidium ambiguum] IAM M-71 TaxID=454136 RepID=A0A1U7I6S6_9CYAN|nr:response regulator [Phormidium ambiguum]OKH32066.1 hypothetical protein NIES2119_27290 [Phormidium ambiguum IAM M-71]